MERMGEDLARMRVSATTLGDLLLGACDRAPDKEALVFPDARLTYAALAGRVMRRARGLWALGVRPRQHVGLLYPSGIDLVTDLFAVALCGGVSVLMNARYKPAELAYVAANADLTTILTTADTPEQVDFTERLREAFPGLTDAADPVALALPGTPHLRRIVRTGTAAPAAGFVDAARFEAGIDGVAERTIHHARLCVRVRDTCMILYTSGTSANPKGCLLSHEAIVREAANLGRYRWGFTGRDRMWSPLPLFHIAALSGLLLAIDATGTFVGLPHFDAGASLRQIREERPTMVFLPFVTFHQAMIAHADFEETDMSCVRLMNSCFVMMPESVGAVYRRKMPNALQCGTYGMTETSGIASTGGFSMEPELGFQRLGFALPGVEIRIADAETGQDLPAGQHGEILVRGYSLFDGYYKDPEKTAQVLDGEGWYHSGDIGSLDGHGHVMFHGRFKEMLKVGGENVAAAEIEAVLARHPAVQLAQVVGLPDARLVEIPAAFIERTPDSTVTAEELTGFVRQQLAGFKVPRHIRFIGECVPEWPMSASKIQKFKLRAALMRDLNLND